MDKKIGGGLIQFLFLVFTLTGGAKSFYLKKGHVFKAIKSIF